MSIKYFFYSFLLHFIFIKSFSFVLNKEIKGSYEVDSFTAFMNYKEFSNEATDTSFECSNKLKVVEAEYVFDNIEDAYWVKEPVFKYPKEAEEKGYEGIVSLIVETLDNGIIKYAEVDKKSYSILDEAALNDIYDSKVGFNGNNRGVKFRVNIPYRLR